MTHACMELEVAHMKDELDAEKADNARTADMLCKVSLSKDHCDQMINCNHISYMHLVFHMRLCTAHIHVHSHNTSKLPPPTHPHHTHTHKYTVHYKTQPWLQSTYCPYCIFAKGTCIYGRAIWILFSKTDYSRWSA